MPEVQGGSVPLLPVLPQRTSRGFKKLNTSVGRANLAPLPTIIEGKELEIPHLFTQHRDREDHQKIKELGRKKLLREVKSVVNQEERTPRYDRNGIRRFYCQLYIGGSTSEAQVDTGADASVVSLPVLRRLCPDWRMLQMPLRYESKG